MDPNSKFKVTLGVVSIHGTVEKVAYHNDENGYCLLKVKAESELMPFTLIGNVPRVAGGEKFLATGSWEHHREHGRQFKTITLQLLTPDSLEGITKYLGSGLIDGIGIKYAKRMVKKFGAKIFDIIEFESAKLEEVEGIGTKRRMEIKASWIKQKAVHEIMIFLHERGISTSRATRIYKTYGEKSLEVLQKNPFTLARDIHGIGFLTADDIAKKMGLAADAPERVRAGILYALDQASQQGHCYLPNQQLMEETQRLLSVDRLVIDHHLTDLLREEKLVRVTRYLQEAIYLQNLYTAETTILTVLDGLQQQHRENDVDPEANKWREKIEEDLGVQLGESQWAAIVTSLAQPVLIITGGPGVGKTTIVRGLLKIYEEQELKVILAAPTGRAARRMSQATEHEALTLHRLLEYKGEAQWGRNQQKKMVGDVFILDEASMIDTRLMASFLMALPQNAKLILVGDADQLPSVGPGRVLQDLISAQRLPCVVLKDIYRQAAKSQIIQAAHAIQGGRIPDLTPQAQSDFFFLKETETTQLVDLMVGLISTRLPKKYGFDPIRDIQLLVPMNRGEVGVRHLNGLIQAAVNPPHPQKLEIERYNQTFRVGDKVIQVVNQYEKEVFNGDMGFIESIDLDTHALLVKFEGEREVVYEPQELDELQLAYALTIHKAQGSEFPCVIMPLSNQHFVMLERSLVYTGLTRAKKLAVFVGEPKALVLAVKKAEGQKRYTGLGEYQ
jgi:exodeoxyribonuclease V alpha subunit